MKFLLALTLLVSSSFSVAQGIDPVIDAVIHDLDSRSIDCDWKSGLNTMSNFEAQYHITGLLGALKTTYTVKNNVIETESITVGGTQRLFTKIVLNKDMASLKRIDFVLEHVEKYTVNTGTIFQPSYEDRYRVKYGFAASCIVR